MMATVANSLFDISASHYALSDGRQARCDACGGVDMHMRRVDLLGPPHAEMIHGKWNAHELCGGLHRVALSCSIELWFRESTRVNAELQNLNRVLHEDTPRCNRVRFPVECRPARACASSSRGGCETLTTRTLRSKRPWTRSPSARCCLHRCRRTRPRRTGACWSSTAERRLSLWSRCSSFGCA